MIKKEINNVFVTDIKSREYAWARAGACTYWSHGFLDLSLILYLVKCVSKCSL